MKLLPLLFLALIGDPVVIDQTSAEPRQVIVLVDGVYYSVTTKPVVGPGPTPTPVPPLPPAPPVPPAPAPVAGTLHVSLIVDVDAMTPAVARLRESPKAREYFAGSDSQYRTYASTSPDAARLNLTAVAGKVGLPAVVIQDQTGKVLWSGRAPPAEDELIKLVQGIRTGAK